MNESDQERIDLMESLELDGTRVAMKMIHQTLSAHAPCTKIFFCDVDIDNIEPTTPTTKITWEQYQKPTAVKARTQETIDFLKSEGITGKNEAGF